MIILYLLPAVMIGVVFMMIRNERVFRYREKIRRKIGIAIDEDFARGDWKHWEWRWAEFDRISYDQMVTQFWKPLDSFWKDKSFTEPAPTNGKYNIRISS